MTNTRTRSFLSGLRSGLLAGLWVLATELCYSRFVLAAPVRLEPSLVAFYGLVFVLVGLGAGLTGAALPRLGPGLPALVAGAGLTALLLGLRVHDLFDAGPNPAIDGGLIALVLAVAAGTAWLARRGSSPGIPGLVLAGYTPVLVLAVKLLVNTCPIQFAHPIPVALGLVGVAPLLLVLACRRLAGARSTVMAWGLPLAVLLVGTFAGQARRGEQGGGDAVAAVASEAPPIVWITIDTLRADHMSLYGYGVRTTPNLEEFARTATVYSAAGSQAPSTWQSVPSLLSGLTPYRHGGVSETRRLPENIRLLPEILRERGYRTVGQSANPWVSARYGMTRGFDEFHLYNTDDQLILYDFMKLAMRLVPWDVFRLREYLPSYAYVPFAALVDDAAEVIRAQKGGQRPLFLYMQPVDPHGPYQAPLSYVPGGGAGFTRRDYVSYWQLKKGVPVTPRQREGIIVLYDGAIAYSDAQVGRIFALLREQGLFDRALIILTADHGEQFFDHGLWRHSNSLYQQLLHVPLLVKYPGQRTGRIVDAPVASFDIMPTVLRVLGDTCAECEGRPLQEAGTAGAPARFAYLMSHEDPKPVMRSVVADGWKLIEHFDGPKREELFNLTTDPAEAHDQRTAKAEVAVRLAALLDGYQAAAGPTLAAEKIEIAPVEAGRLRALGYVQ